MKSPFRSLNVLTATLLALAGAVAAPAAFARDAALEIEIPLAGTASAPAASGTAKYKVDRGTYELSIEVEDVSGAEVVTFVVNGEDVGSLVLSAGFADLNLESRNAASVPALTADSLVEVYDGDSGALLLSSDPSQAGDGVEPGDDNGGNGNEPGDDNGGNGNEPGDDHGDDDEGEDDGEGDDDSEGEGDDDSEGEGDDDSEGEGDDDSEGEGDDDSEGEGDDNSEGEGDDDNGTEYEYVLFGTALEPTATGVAEYKPDEDRRRVEVQVQGIQTATRVSAFVDGINIGSSRVRFGAAEVERDETLSFTVPTMTPDSLIQVLNADTGAVLLTTPVQGGTEGEPEGSPEGEGEPPAPNQVLKLTHKVGPNGRFVPGQTVIIEASITKLVADRITALSIEQTLPEGWEFVRNISTLGAFIDPNAGQTGTVVWAWINVPGGSFKIQYEVFVPAIALGVQTLEGRVIFRRNAGEEYAVASTTAPAAEGFTTEFCHSADQDRSWTINLSEVLRSIQFYTLREYHCEDGSEDGYAPGSGDRTCTPHDADHVLQDWRFELGELLRIIQFFNSPGNAYQVADGTEDGFLPGIFTLN